MCFKKTSFLSQKQSCCLNMKARLLFLLSLSIFALSFLIPHDKFISFMFVFSSAFPMFVLPAEKKQSTREVKLLSVILVLCLSVFEMLVDLKEKRFMQTSTCILVSNALLFGDYVSFY